jgi:hypothetical protein
MWTPLTKSIYNSLNDLASTCGLQGESGSEELFDMLGAAYLELDAECVLEESHEEGLCLDMNAELAHKIEKYLTNNQPRGH